MLHDVIGREVERQREDFDVAGSGQMFSELLRQNHQIVAGGNNGGDSQKAGHGERDFAADFFGLQRLFEDAVPGAGRRNGQMAFRLEFFESELAVDAGMMVAKRAYESLPEQSLLAKAGSHWRNEAYGQIQFARFQQAGSGGSDSLQIDGHRRSFLSQVAHELGDQGDLGDVGGLNAEGPAGGARVEDNGVPEGGLQEAFRLS